jgi:hypothetical protein
LLWSRTAVKKLIIIYFCIITAHTIIIH